MNPFIFNSESLLAICTACQFAVVTDELQTHLQKRHPNITTTNRRSIIEAVSSIPGIINSQARLSELRYPDPNTEPILHLGTPKYDGIQCNNCPYICRQVRKIQEHYRKNHGWENDWKKGGNVTKRSNEARQLPWTTGVQCQRFFPSRAGSRWFEVGRGQASSEEPHVDAEMTPDQRAMEYIQRIRQQQAARVEASQDEIIRSANEKTEPNPWLNRVGWAEHLKGLHTSQLRETTNRISDDEDILQKMWDIVSDVLDRARATATPMAVGLAVLFEVQRKDVDVKPTRPFDNRLEDDTWARYKEVWRTVLCVWFRTQVMFEEERPPYILTDDQGTLFDRFEVLVKAASDGEAESSDELKQVALDMLISMINHKLKRGEYENVLISSLAVMAIREDGGWLDIKDYTTKYSAIIKVARMLVVLKADWQRKKDVAILAKRMDEQKADERVESTFVYVRDNVRRFMTRTSGHRKAEPTPMDWILDTRTYGMHVQYNTPAEGAIDWVGDRVSFRRIRFGMGQLSDMLHGVVNEARELLAELAMVDEGGIPTTDGHERSTGDIEKLRAALPRINWASIEDDHSNERPGYSFLEDDRNPWLTKGEDWVFSRVAQSEQRSRHWGASGETSQGGSLSQEAVRGYERTFEQFRERLWLSMHMLGGQPGRATEIGGLRTVNTVNGGVRNIFAHNGMMCFVTAYHKGYRSTGQTKVIHRYLPREVGELLVWYLWLVLPFWKEVQGATKQAGRYSAFLWADEVVQKKVEAAGGDGSEESDETAEWMWKDDRTWTTDRARRIMQRYSSRLLGNKFNVSMWRHIAIAIANRFLNEAFGQEGRNGEDDEEDDELEDSPWDLQAGHGTRLAGMIYARLRLQFGSGVAAKQQKFRKVSCQWHRFFHFGAEDRTNGGPKRKVEPYDGVRLEVRLRRFARLQQTDLMGQLRQMTSNDEATFRGNQAEVIRAIVNGHSPVLQIMGTGGGKSLSFMLPAFCAPDGVTIVVTPLVALRTDLDARCRKAGITSHIWQSCKNNQAASIIFVTPESAVSKGFRDFVGLLESRQALDRVVVDECHVVLEGTQKFRPKLRELGSIIQEFGAQLVCLTATLAPADEEAFFGIMRIQRGRVQIFRAPSTRKNIGYKVLTVAKANNKGIKTQRPKTPADNLDEIDKETCRVVRRWLSEGQRGKMIVYATSIERVERLGAALECATFYSDVDTAQGKAERLEAWRRGNGKDGGLVIATNALGLGIDIPDIRSVVHADMPRQLRQFVQESGRGGRDGERSESIIVCYTTQTDGKQGGKGVTYREAAVDEFISGVECRRVVLDRVMDGRMDRFECEEGEERCDNCEARFSEAGMDAVLEQGEAEETVPEDSVKAFESRERRLGFERWQLERRTMGESEEVESFKRLLGIWDKWCPRCWECGRKTEHRLFECRDTQVAEVLPAMAEGIRLAREGIFGAKRFEDFSACFQCGLPQEICEAWERQEGDGTGFRKRVNGVCQYGDRLLELYGWGMIRAGPAGVGRVKDRMMEEEGHVVKMDDVGMTGWYE